MSRTADYTIQGFLYQFNKTLVEILKAEDDVIINVEGVIEDVEVVTPTKVTGIQCKYHEANRAYTPSAIYKPLLQMLGHFSAYPDNNIDYILFAHFPDMVGSHPPIGKSECEAALRSRDRSLNKLIEKVSSTVDIDAFVGRFKIEFGPSYNDLVGQVIKSLKENGFPSDDVKTLAYPNAIHIVANTAIRHDPAQRQVTRKGFLDQLNEIRTTAISRWTMALHTRKKLLEARRKQLKVNLDKNTRLRYFVINPSSFSDYNSEIVLFISDYIDKYHFKPAHINTPVFCFCTSHENILLIEHRLYQKDIIATNGYIGGKFEESYFFREPLKNSKGQIVQREFSLRITDWEEHGTVLNNKKCDDLFIFGELDMVKLEMVDMNVERLESTTIKEIKFLMGMSNVYD